MIVSVSGIGEHTLADVDAFCAQMDSRACRCRCWWHRGSRAATGSTAIREPLSGWPPAAPVVPRSCCTATTRPPPKSAAASSPRCRPRSQPAVDGGRPGARAPRATHQTIRTAALAGFTGYSQGFASQWFSIVSGAARDHRLGPSHHGARPGARHRGGFLTEPWWCRMLVLSAERVARRGGIVRVAVAARHLRKPGRCRRCSTPWTWRCCTAARPPCTSGGPIRRFRTPPDRPGHYPVAA
ncbi:hypothetical protein I553_5296 [Mycobacterium xenopi 4042]|uniref:Uncharacterized protein n=1 Tax=Mycobacterium xenopi 4042 TaxID=1299334 RepID=X7ZXT0_MYCXE|nr:hypothetical protein I553_5296 [Mycobacterium xenopi 4042]